NIIGSNIANVFLVLGLPALVYPITAHVEGLRRHAIVMLVATAAFAAIAYGTGEINQTTGAILFSMIIAYIVYMGWVATRGATHDPVLDEIAEYAEGARGNMGATLVFLIAGLIGLPVGAHLLVTSGSSLAADLGVRPEVIGLTIIAFGTSLPELATVLAAAFHKKSDVAIGNIVGSNIFNILAVGGVAGLVGRAPFDPASLSLDVPVMAVATLALAAYVFGRRDIGRLSGLIFVIAYGGFLTVLVLGH
ncbi:MAG: hypothetical protein KDA46_03885, partial [Parvularculaceae bacterium]|nr:hypothetical protein [Parvularculaceae bacterium]